MHLDRDYAEKNVKKINVEMMNAFLETERLEGSEGGMLAFVY